MAHRSSVVVGNLNIIGVTIVPSKANPPLIIDSNAVLTLAVSRQSFEPISWGRSEICEVSGIVNLRQLSVGNSHDIPGNTLYVSALPSSLRRGVSERLDHFSILLTEHVS
jgi:hypothetical protein